MLGDMSVINDDLPLGTDRLAYRYLKYFPSTFTAIFNGASKAGWEDLAVGSEVTSLPFPAKVPMHFIYGDVTHSLDTLEEIKDVAFLLQGLLSLAGALIKLPGRISELEKAAAPLGKVLDRALLEKGIMDEATFKEASELLNKNNLLRFQEFLKAELEIAQNGMSFAEMAKFSSTITGFMQMGSVVMGVVTEGPASLLKMPIDLFFVIQRLIFSGQPHDTFVPKWSATAAFPEYSTGFPIAPGIFDFWHFKYGEICHQNDVAEFVGYLLKDAPLSKFAVLEESLPLPGSFSAKTSSNGDSDSDIDIDFENFYVKNFSLAIRKSTRENFGEGMTALKFIAETTIKTSNDVKLVVQKDSLDRIFPMFSENGLRFESVLVFSSSDEGAMTAYCYARSILVVIFVAQSVQELTHKETAQSVSYNISFCADNAFLIVRIEHITQVIREPVRVVHYPCVVIVQRGNMLFLEAYFQQFAINARLAFHAECIICVAWVKNCTEKGHIHSSGNQNHGSGFEFQL